VTGHGSSQPLVSILIPAFNAGPYLAPALASALGQTYSNIEVLLIDDGSTDGSVEAAVAGIGDPRLRVIRQGNAGRAAALNRGLDEAKGEFYTTVDADDLCAPNRVERQVAALLANPQLACVFCGYDLVLHDKHTAPLFQERTVEECRSLIDRFRMPGHDPTGMWRMERVRGERYDESLKIGAAFDYILRVGEKHAMLVLGECLYSYRIHGGGVTKKDPGVRLKFLKEIRRRAMVRRGVADAEAELEKIAWFRPRRWSNRDYDNNLAARFVESVLCLRRAGRLREAALTGLAGAKQQPLDPYYYKALVFSVLPLNVVQKWRRSPV
jgi:glycosyltransferase involved in cell wall biosynthesis